MQLYKDNESASTYLDILEGVVEDSRSSEAKLRLEFKEITVRLEEKSRANEKLEREAERMAHSLMERDKRIEKISQEMHQMRTKVALTEVKLEESGQGSFRQFVVSTLGAILLGFGTNVVTVTPGNWIAWVLIITSIILSMVAFTFVRKGRLSI